VTANDSTFYAAGVEARRRMAAAGFDVSAGDTWAVNELSSAVRAGTNVARQKVRDLVHGLYDGDGTLARVKGIVFDIGIDQSTPDLAPYKVALQAWYQDAGFWQDMSAYVSDWSQELYGDVRDEAVAGATAVQRIAHLDDYLGHQRALAEAAPPTAAAARAFLEQADSPLANAAWMWDSGFGYTDVPLDQMEDYVSAEVAALRSGPDAGHFGFAWAPHMADGSSWTAQFTADTGTLLDRLAAAIHDSASAPAGACGTSWCTAALAGAAFTDAWQAFASWSPTTLAFSAPPASVTAGAPSGPLTVQLVTDGVAQPALAPTTVTLTSSSPGGRFAPSAAGPWTGALALTIPAGVSSAAFAYEDAGAGTPVVTAAAAGLGAATQTETIAAAAPPPPAAPSQGGSGGGVPPDLHVSLAADAAAAPPVGAQLVYRVSVTTANAGSASDVRLALHLPPAYTVARSSADRGPGCTGAGPDLTCDAGWISPGTGTTVTVVGTVTGSGALTASATATSLVEAVANPADGTATLTLAAPAAPAPPVPAPLERTPPRPPRILGTGRVGSRLRVAAAVWRGPATHVAYRWQLCSRRGRCTTIRGATRGTLLLRAAYVRRWVRVVATATVAGRRVAAGSAPLAVRR
jgi:hypothetical protein